MPKIEYTKKICICHTIAQLNIQLSIFKYIGGINKKVVPNLIIDEEIVLWGNAMVLSGVIYHKGQQSDHGYYTSGVEINNTWFSISDTRVLRQKKCQCNPRDVSVSVPNILIFERRNNLVMPPSSLLNDPVGIFPSSEIISESSLDIMSWQSVIKELEKQKTAIDIA